jgi:two-component system, NtrC family, response regulator HydG
LQEGEVRPLGSVESRKVDVRLIAATHRDLRKLTKENKFREDLYFRLNVVQLELPPLRQRGRDIITIAEYLLQRYCAQFNKPLLKLSEKAIEAVMNYPWPGNVRELENAMQRAVILCEDNEIGDNLLSIDMEAGDIGDETTSSVIIAPRIANRSNPGNPGAEDLSLEDYFQRFVLEHQDRMSETELAKKLGVSRKCLWERRQRLGIPRTKGAATSTVK